LELLLASFAQHRIELIRLKGPARQYEKQGPS
jgi:hypothetical protein